MAISVLNAIDELVVVGFDLASFRLSCIYKNLWILLAIKPRKLATRPKLGVGPNLVTLKNAKTWRQAKTWRRPKLSDIEKCQNLRKGEKVFKPCVL